MDNPKRAGTFLVLTGVALVLIAVGALSHEYSMDHARRAQTTRPGETDTLAPPTATRTVSRTAMRLGPTAAAAATRLPPPTPIPTAGLTANRPSAPLRIIIPAVGIDAYVVEVGWGLVRVDGELRGMWNTVAGAAGHHRGSADPGQPGNCVLSAHSSDAGGAVFRHLDELVNGDTVELQTVDDHRYEYIVSTVLTLDELGATSAEKRVHARWLDPTQEPVLTLVTCWPAWSYTHRIVVRANLNAP